MLFWNCWNSAVQEAVVGKSYYHCDKVVVITNNYFTPSAKELAQSNDVILWDRDILKEKIKELMWEEGIYWWACLAERRI